MRDEANEKSAFVQIRRKHNLTQKQVAEAIGISEQAIRNWERGRSQPQLTIPQIKALCTLLNCQVFDLPDNFGSVEPETQNADRDDGPISEIEI